MMKLVRHLLVLLSAIKLALTFLSSFAFPSSIPNLRPLVNAHPHFIDQMQKVNFVPSGPGAPARAKRLPPQEWAAHRQNIEDLYVDQGKSLDEVMVIMASRHGLNAKYVALETEQLANQTDILQAGGSIMKSFDSGKSKRTFPEKSCDPPFARLRRNLNVIRSPGRRNQFQNRK
jgi:hypothetical protein